RAVQFGVGRRKRALGNLGDGVALGALKSFVHGLSNHWHPCARRPLRIYENESSNRRVIIGGGEHADPTAPGMSEQMPAPDAECPSECADVGSIVFDRRVGWIGRGARYAASALVV